MQVAAGEVLAQDPWLEERRELSCHQDNFLDILKRGEATSEVAHSCCFRRSWSSAWSSQTHSAPCCCPLCDGVVPMGDSSAGSIHGSCSLSPCLCTWAHFQQLSSPSGFCPLLGSMGLAAGTTSAPNAALLHSLLFPHLPPLASRSSSLRFRETQSEGKGAQGIHRFPRCPLQRCCLESWCVIEQEAGDSTDGKLLCTVNISRGAWYQQEVEEKHRMA